MSIDVAYQGPSTDGVDFSNPFQTMQYQISQNAAIQRAIEQLAQRANEPKYIRLHGGKTLDDMAEGSSPWTGVVWACDNTLAEARREAAKRGMRVCDGMNNMPDMRDKFLRGAAAAGDAGTIGGADSASVSIAISPHTEHTHTYSCERNSCTPQPLTQVVACSGGVEVGGSDHTHLVSISGTTDGPSAQLTHTSCSVSIGTVPSYYGVIFVRKA